MKISITAITEPNINPNHKTKLPMIRLVKIMFHTSRNGNRIMFSIVFIFATLDQSTLIRIRNKILNKPYNSLEYPDYN